MPNGPDEQLDLSDYPDYETKDLQYTLWRNILWSMGWGSYAEIDRAVRRGELTMGKYPKGYKPLQGSGPQAV